MRQIPIRVNGPGAVTHGEDVRYSVARPLKSHGAVDWELEYDADGGAFETPVNPFIKDAGVEPDQNGQGAVVTFPMLADGVEEATVTLRAVEDSYSPIEGEPDENDRDSLTVTVTRDAW